MRNNCKDSPCHPPEELRRRLKEEKLTLDDIRRIIITRLKSK